MRYRCFYTARMCGRYNLLPDAQAWADIGAVLGELLGEQLRAQPPRYNIAPTQRVPIIVADPASAAEPRLIEARWGFVPEWWRQDVFPTLTTNARAETAASKPMWREAWKRQRCLIPASSWYEWFVLDSGQKKPPKIPHLIERADGKHILFAGLWSLYPTSGDAEPLPTCSIVTLPSAPDLAEIHERTPVVLNPSFWRDWLNPALTDPDTVMRLASEGAAEQFRLQPLATTVSNARNKGADCVTPRLWPELLEQGSNKPSPAQLQTLRHEERQTLQASLQLRLQTQSASKAERRLWLRELQDRDDAEHFAPLLSAIRSSLAIDSAAATGKAGKLPGQGLLF